MVVDRILKWAVLLDNIELKKSGFQSLNTIDLSDVALLLSFGTFVHPESPEEDFFILNRVFIEKNSYQLNPNVIIFRNSENINLCYADLPDIADLSFYINEALGRIDFIDKKPHYHILRFDKVNIEDQDKLLKTWTKQTLNL